MRRFVTPALILGCLAAITFACYGRAIGRGEQFAYRDAAHYYYPLYQRVQAGWEAGQWPPLWEPEENSGMPLLGNPTAAVLYPGKLVFAAFSYPLGVRLYVVGHTLLAFGAMLWLLRGWGTSWVGSALGATGYAFGGPVLFQYCNIIYLVGAAWLPLGFLAADRWVRLGRTRALAGLAGVLAMETLGGDPESAYLTGVCAGGYALALARAGRNGVAGEDLGASRRRGWPVAFRVVLAVALLGVWVFGTLTVARWAPGLRPVSDTRQPTPAFPWVFWVRPAVSAAWGSAAVVLLFRWRRLRRTGGRPPVLVPVLAGLGVSAVLAAAVSAAQLLPVLEFTSQSGRAAGDGPHDIFPFSLQPLRVAEFLWPNLYGTPFRGNRLWVAALPPRTENETKVWVPTLYVGGLTLVLALGSGRGRGSAPWRGWLAAVAAISLLGSFGECGGPLWLARIDPGLAASVGPHDPRDVTTIRTDRYLRDGDGSVYWALANALPGFRQFRFPSKLLTFTVLALTALAGQGWDALASGDPRARRGTAAWAGAALGVSLAALAWTVARRGAIVGYLGALRLTSDFGPFDAPGALAETQSGLVQAAVVAGLGLALALNVRRFPRAAPALALLVTTGDLAAANARYVTTVPQRVLETTPEVLSVIRKAEQNDPSAGPYRIHRVPLWSPASRRETPSADRARDFVEWERETIQPKYGITEGVQYTMTLGVAELYDYEWFFGGFYFGARGDAARFLGVAPSTSVVVYPRRAFDMWNSRYFVLPYYPKWEDEHRGIASFLDRTERICPAPDAFRGPDGRKKELDWLVHHDYQVRRNLDSYPRAWVVHDARTHRPFLGLSRESRKLTMEEIVFSDDLFWRDPTRTVYDPRQVVWVEESERSELSYYLPGNYTSPREGVKVRRYGPQRVELEAVLERPGVVVLADVYYPGWRLTIDGRPAPVYRANRMMRGAAVPSGRHVLVYTYQPASFRIGLAVSAAGLLALGLLTAWTLRAPLHFRNGFRPPARP